MRIAVASDDGVAIAAHFGRCAGFLVFEIESGVARNADYRPNRFGHHAHGHDRQEHASDHEREAHSHSGFIGALSDCEAVICRGMGRKAVADLAAMGIRPAITSEDLSAQVAADRYAQGRLNASTESTGCSH